MRSTPGALTDHWLVVVEEAFAPTHAGGRVETLGILRALTAARIRCHVVVPTQPDDDLAALRRLVPEADFTFVPRRTGLRTHLGVTPYLFASRPLPLEVAEDLAAVDPPFTAVLAASFRVVHMGQALAARLRVPLLVRPHNLESEYFRHTARARGTVAGAPYLLEAWRLRRVERAVHTSGGVTAFADISREDADRRASRTDRPVVHIPPFLTTTLPEPPDPSPVDASRQVVLFLGSLDTPHNLDAVESFLRASWGRVRAACSEAEMHVVGRNPPEALRRSVESLQHAGVRLFADVPSVAPHLKAAQVFVNPVRQGAGVNIKMVEAMANRLPVVATTPGSRGLHWEHGRHLLVADDPDEFADAVIALLQSPDRRLVLAAAGADFVTRELDAQVHVQRLKALLPSPGARPTRPGDR